MDFKKYASGEEFYTLETAVLWTVNHEIDSAEPVGSFNIFRIDVISGWNTCLDENTVIDEQFSDFRIIKGVCTFVGLTPELIHIINILL